MDDRPRLDQINLVVGAMGPAVEFYRLLGVDIEDPPAPWDDHHRTVDTDDGLDLDMDSGRFAQQWNRGWTADRSGVVLGFRVIERDTVDEIYARLTDAVEHGAPATAPPRTATAILMAADSELSVVMLRQAEPMMRRDPQILHRGQIQLAFAVRHLTETGRPHLLLTWLGR